MMTRQGFGVRLGCIAWAVAALFATAPAVGGGYVFQTIDAPGPGSATTGGTYAFGVNASGLVSGYYEDASGAYHGFIWQNGKATSIDYTGISGVSQTFLFQDNSSGQVAGYYTGADGTSHSLIYNSANGTWTTIPDAPGKNGFNAAGGINDKGQLAGNYSLGAAGNTNLVAWLYDIKSNTYTPFTVPQSDQSLFGSATYGMNNHGDIAGYYQDASSNYHGFVWDPTTGSRIIDVASATAGTFALGVNDSNTVVGNYYIGSTSYGFLLGGNNKLTSFMFAGATSTWISGLDDAGDITGYYEDAKGNFPGFYGQAVPNGLAACADRLRGRRGLHSPSLRGAVGRTRSKPGMTR